MKSILISITILLTFTVICQSQTVDTVNTYGFGKMPPIYMGNTLYWERNYEQSKDGQSVTLSFIGLSYNDCHVGAYTVFYPSGKIKMTGQFKENTTGDWRDLRNRGLCSIQTGEWKEYSEDGTLTKTYLYEDGKVVKEY